MWDRPARPCSAFSGKGHRVTGRNSPQGVQSGEGDAGRGAVGGDEDFRVLAEGGVPADLVFFNLRVFCRQALVEGVALLGVQK